MEREETIAHQLPNSKLILLSVDRIVDVKLGRSTAEGRDVFFVKDFQRSRMTDSLH